MGYPGSAGGGDVVVAALVTQLDAMLAQVGHAAQRTFTTVERRGESVGGRFSVSGGGREEDEEEVSLQLVVVMQISCSHAAG